MPYIKVDVDRINEYQKSVYSVRNKVKSITSDFSSIGYNVDSDIKDCSDIRRKIERINSSLSDFNLLLDRMNSFFGNTLLKYLSAEKLFYDNTNSAGNYYNITNIDELAETIAKKENLDVSDITNAIVSGEYSLEEIVKYAGGMSASGAFSAYINVIASSKTTKTESTYDDAQTNEAIFIAAKELGVSENDIHDMIDKGLCNTADIVEFIEGKAKGTNKFVKNASKVIKGLTGSAKVLFQMKDGYVIVSKFTRDGWFNKLVQWANDGTGLGTRYTVDGLKGTPIAGTVYTVGEIAKKVDKVVNVVTAVTTGTVDIIEAGSKINNIWADDSLSKKEKIIDTSAVVVTSAIGTALDVAAPFAGTAVQAAVTAAIPVPIVGAAVGWVAGQLVEGGMRLVSDVITSEAVVNQVSDSIGKVGDAVSSGVAAVSDAGKKLMESKNAGEAIANTANLVGSAVVAGAKVVSTAVVETAKVAVTVVKETAKAVASTVKKAANKVKNFFKKW